MVSVWLAIVLSSESAIPSASEHYSDNRPHNRICSRVSPVSLGLWRAPSGSCVLAATCRPARDRLSIQLFLFAASKQVHAVRLDAAILRFRGAVPRVVGSALDCCCNTCVARCQAAF